MSKKRKTKKEKIIAATRHVVPQTFTISTAQNTSHITLDTQPLITNNFTPTTHVASTNYSYVATDIRKTLMITTILIALDILFFFSLKTKLISFNGIVF